MHWITYWLSCKVILLFDDFREQIWACPRFTKHLPNTYTHTHSIFVVNSHDSSLLSNFSEVIPIES